MANWFDPTQPTQPQTFNYQSEQDKVKRQRDLATALMQSKQPTGQMVPGGPNGFYVKPSLMANLAPMIQQIMGAVMQGKADDAQKSLDTTAQSEMTNAYKGVVDAQTSGVRNADQDGFEAAAQLKRESQRGSGVDAGQMMDGQAVSDAFDASRLKAQEPPPAVAAPIVQPSAPVPQTPVSSVTPSVKKMAATALPGTGPGAGRGKQGAPSAAELAAYALDKQGSTVNPVVNADDPTGSGSFSEMGGKLLDGIKKLYGFKPEQPAAPVAPPVQAGPPALPPMPQQQAVPQAMPQTPVQPPIPAQTPPQGMPNTQAAPMPPMPVQQAVPQPAQPGVPGMGVVNGRQTQISDPNPYNHRATDAEMASRVAALAQTGPQGAKYADMMAQQMGPKAYEYDYIKMDDGRVIAANKRNSSDVRVVDAGSGSGGKPLEYKTDSSGNMIERRADGTWHAAQMAGGGNVMTNDAQQQQAKESDSKTADATKLVDMKQQLSQMKDLVPLLSKVGTGRLQTPFNNLKAYVSDSTDLDKLNRGFNQQKLEGAATWLKGQGSVSDAERSMLAQSQFDPKASTQANMDYANLVIGLLNKHIPLAEQNFATKYGTGSAAPTSAPSGAMYSWQKK